MQTGGKVVLSCVGVGLLVILGNAVDRANVQATAPSSPRVPQVATTVETDSDAPVGLGEGRWEIGTDVAPGKYRTSGPSDDAFPLCSWFVLTADGEYKDAGNSRGPVTYTVPRKPGELFETSGCAPWVPA